MSNSGFNKFMNVPNATNDTTDCSMTRLLIPRKESTELALFTYTFPCTPVIFYHIF